MLTGSIAMLTMFACSTLAASVGDPLDACNVVWDSPSKDSTGSMPLGNGDIGLNVWMENSGDLVFYIGKTDAWSGNGRLDKVGRVRISLSPALDTQKGFTQVLRLRQGEIQIISGENDARRTLRVWVDANHPVIHVAAEGAKPFGMRSTLEVWRTSERVLIPEELSSVYGMAEAPHPVYEGADTVVPDDAKRILWFHCNTRSIWEETLRLQGMEDWISLASDPLLNRIFGGLMEGDGFRTVSPTQLQSQQDAPRHALAITILTTAASVVRPSLTTPVSSGKLTLMSDDEFAQKVGDAVFGKGGVKTGNKRLNLLDSLKTDASTDSKKTEEKTQDWVKCIRELALNTSVIPEEKAYAEHLAWWDAFWKRSWVRVSGTPDAELVTRVYTLQRFVTACAGRGAQPIKFNGSIFTMDATEKEKKLDADYRRWGGPYWFQNTRLPYWPMLASGDFEMMKPLFDMYGDALPFAQARTRKYFNHDGAFFPETMYFWGAYANDNYGWNRTDKPASYVENTYIRWHFNGQIELLAMMLDYYAYTQDKTFLQEVLSPFAEQILLFADQHYPHGEEVSGGRTSLILKPGQALETWQDVENPLPDIAGLQWVLRGLTELADALTPNLQRLLIRFGLPQLPQGEVDGKKVLLPAEKINGKIANCENPELYAIYPFRIFGVGKPNLDLARTTFAQRRFKDSHRGWGQDDTQAAYLGLANEAQSYLVERFSQAHPETRFPGFWGPNFDWTPDQDHGCNGVMALQTMLMQCEGKVIRLLPAWPKNWAVSFKLHAPLNTVIEGEYRNGKIESLIVTPPERKDDIKVLEAQ